LYNHYDIVQTLRDLFTGNKLTKTTTFEFNIPPNKVWVSLADSFTLSISMSTWIMVSRRDKCPTVLGL